VESPLGQAVVSILKRPSKEFPRMSGAKVMPTIQRSQAFSAEFLAEKNKDQSSTLSRISVWDSRSTFFKTQRPNYFGE